MLNVSMLPSSRLVRIKVVSAGWKRLPREQPTGELVITTMISTFRRSESYTLGIVEKSTAGFLAVVGEWDLDLRTTEQKNKTYN